ncbi:hypothetical protein NP233_g3572 [Leucocoprinus birnbaumii]|uniref:Uncharacterized protein n=1 Tax=Leucocoprinus birnbaumii TaxID=56174 RepID=A0AAD5YY84_9AGAR|nr:hypothetical protein NP233_g3572 [Leucocoprinus birnbaumii]
MTADPRQLHPLVLDMRTKLAEAKALLRVRWGWTSHKDASARLSPHLGKEVSRRVFGQMSTLLSMMMEYRPTEARTDEALVRESVIVGLVEWMVKEMPDPTKVLLGADTYQKLKGESTGLYRMGYYLAGAVLLAMWVKKKLRN